MPGLKILDIRPKEFLRAPPDYACAISQWYLIQGPALTAYIAKIGPAGLLPNQSGFKQ
jgi:hypothetical protein